MSSLSESPFLRSAGAALKQAGTVTRLEHLGVCMHRVEHDAVYSMVSWRPYLRTDNGIDVGDAIAATAGIPWRESLVRSCLAEGRVWTPNLHRDLSHGTWAHATGFHTALAIPAGVLNGDRIFIIGLSREQLLLSDRILGEVYRMAESLAADANLHVGTRTDPLTLGESWRAPAPRIGIVDRSGQLAAIAPEIPSADLRVDAYDDVEDALTDFRAVRPDVVVVDADIPSGGRLPVERVRLDPGLEDTPVLGVSASLIRAIDFARLGYDAGMNAADVDVDRMKALASAFADGWNPNPRSPLLRTSAPGLVPASGLARLRTRARALARRIVLFMDRHGDADADMMIRDVVLVAEEFNIARAYATTLYQMNIGRAAALTAFREVAGGALLRHREAGRHLARIEATCLEAFDAQGLEDVATAAVPRASAIAEALRQRIALDVHMGRSGPGDRLPGMRELAVEFAADHRTVSRACRILANDGFIELRARSGIYIAQRIHRMSQPTSWLAGLIVDAPNHGVNVVDLPAVIGAAVAPGAKRVVCVGGNDDHVRGLMKALADSFGTAPVGLRAEELKTTRGLSILRAADIVVTTAFCRAAVTRAARGLECLQLEMIVESRVAAALLAALDAGPTFLVGTDPHWATWAMESAAEHHRPNLRAIVAGREDTQAIPDGVPVFVMPAAAPMMGSNLSDERCCSIRYVFSEADALAYVGRLLTLRPPQRR